MVKKVAQGSYECSICGDRIDGFVRAKRHQELCGVVSIENFVDHASMTFERPEGTVDNSQQLNLKGQKTNN